MNEIKFKAVEKDTKKIYDVVGINWDENGKITSVFVNNNDEKIYIQNLHICLGMKNG